MTTGYCVFVVVDKQYGERLRELVRTGPVWVVDSPTNRSAAEKLWAERPDASHLEGVTIYNSSATSPEDALLEELDTIDLHHGAYSADPPYTILEAIGASATDKVKAELAHYGFNQVFPTGAGFRAIRPLDDAVIRR